MKETAFSCLVYQQDQEFLALSQLGFLISIHQAEVKLDEVIYLDVARVSILNS